MAVISKGDRHKNLHYVDELFMKRSQKLHTTFGNCSLSPSRTEKVYYTWREKVTIPIHK